MEFSQPSFEKFISTINKEQARDLVRSINLFMRNFKAKEADAESDSKAVQVCSLLRVVRVELQHDVEFVNAA